MNKRQLQILKSASNSQTGVLAAPQYQLTLDEARAYCGLHNLGFIKLGRDYSVLITQKGRDRLLLENNC